MSHGGIGHVEMRRVSIWHFWEERVGVGGVLWSNAWVVRDEKWFTRKRMY